MQGLPEEDTEKTGVCPICDSKVDLDATKCPECKADLSVFGVKVEGEEDADVSLSEVGDSLEKLLGEIGKKDETKERALFDEIMAAVDTTDLPPGEAEAVEAGTEAPPQPVAEAEAPAGEAPSPPAPPPEAPPAEGSVMFECPLCNTLVDETASACPGCGAIFATPEAEAPAETGAEEGPYPIKPPATVLGSSRSTRRTATSPTRSPTSSFPFQPARLWPGSRNC